MTDELACMKRFRFGLQAIMFCAMCLPAIAEQDVAPTSKFEPLIFQVPEGWRKRYFPKDENAAADHYQLEFGTSFSVLMRCNEGDIAAFEQALRAAGGAGEPINGTYYAGLALRDTNTYAMEKPIRMQFRVTQGSDCWLGSYGGTAADWQTLIELLRGMKGV